MAKAAGERQEKEIERTEACCSSNDMAELGTDGEVERDVNNVVRCLIDDICLLDSIKAVDVEKRHEVLVLEDSSEDDQVGVETGANFELEQESGRGSYNIEGNDDDDDDDYG